MAQRKVPGIEFVQVNASRGFPKAITVWVWMPTNEKPTETLSGFAGELSLNVNTTRVWKIPRKASSSGE